MATPSQTSRPDAAVTAAEADRSVRGPVLLLWLGAVGWLALAALGSLLSSVQMHAPGFLADTAWLTHGRLQLAGTQAWIYGFGLPAGLGATLWLLARLGRTRLELPTVAAAGAILWNLAVLVGVVGILAGAGTGHDGFEFPAAAVGPLFVGYGLVAWSALETFRRRCEGALYPSQWFLLAALFWFPWIYSTTALVLWAVPARGILQAAVCWWYLGNLYQVWFALVGLGVLLYLVPAWSGRPLHGRAHVVLAFWLLVLFGGWRGIPPHAPLPAWMPAVSTVSSVLSLVPLLAVSIALLRTLTGSGGRRQATGPWWLVVVATTAYGVAGLLSIAAALPEVDRVTAFTLFESGWVRLFLAGFFGLAMFAAMYALLPRLLPEGLPSPVLVRIHVWGSVFGVALEALPLLAGGVVQGLRNDDPQVAFLDALRPGLMALRISTLGDLAVAVASLALVINLAWGLARWGRNVGQRILAEALRRENGEVAR